jgi:hypothetical protein
MTTQRRGRRWHRHGLRHISEVLPEVFRRIGPDRHRLIDDPPPGPDDDPEEDGDSEHDE